MYGVEPIADADEETRRRAWPTIQRRSSGGTPAPLIARGARAVARQFEHLAELTGAGELISGAA